MDFAAMKRRELQALCKRHGLAAGGTNADLIARLDATLSGSDGAAEEAVGVVVGKGCLKRSPAGASGGDSDAARKVTFELEEDEEVGVTGRGRRRSQVLSSPAVAKTRGRQKAREAPPVAKGNGGERRRTRAQAAGDSADESHAGVAGADAPVRRPGRNAVNLGAGDGAERVAGAVTWKNSDKAEHEEVDVGDAVGRKRKTRQNDIEDVDVSGQVGVSRRSTRSSSLLLERDALSSPVEKKRGRRKTADVKEKTCVEEQPTEALHSARTPRSGVVLVSPLPPIVSESKKSRGKLQEEGPAVEKVCKVEISGRTTRSSSAAPAVISPRVIVKKRGRKTVDVHSDGGPDMKVENKKQPSRPESCDMASATNMQIKVPGPVRRSTRKSVVPTFLEHETNGMNEDVEKKQTVKKSVGRSTRRSVAPVILEKESKGLPEEIVPEAYVKRLTRKSVIPAMLEKGRKSIITEMIPAARVKKSTRKPALPMVNSENNDHRAVVSSENLQSDKSEELEKQPTVKQPVRRLTRKSAVLAMPEKARKGVPDMLDNENDDRTEMQSDKVGHLEKQLVKELVRGSTGKSVVPVVIEKENKGLHEELKSEVFVNIPVCKSVVPNVVNKKKDHDELVRMEELSVKTRSAHTRLQVALQNDKSLRRTTRKSSKLAISPPQSKPTASKGRPAKRRRTSSLQEDMPAEEQKEDLTAYEAHTNDVIEVATSTDLEIGVLPFAAEKSDLRDSQPNSELEGMLIVEPGAGRDETDKDILEIELEGTVGTTEKSPSSFPIPDCKDVGALSEEAVHSIVNDAGRCSPKFEQSPTGLQFLISQGITERSATHNAIPCPENSVEESDVHKFQCPDETVVSSKSDSYQCSDENSVRVEESGGRTFSAQQNNEQEGFSVSSFPKDLVADPSEDADHVVRNVITKDLICKEEEKKDFIPSSDINVPYEISPANEPAENASGVSRAVICISQSTPISDDVNTDSSRLESLASTTTEAAQQDNEEEHNLHYGVTHSTHASGMSEVLLPDVETSAFPDVELNRKQEGNEFEEHGFSCCKDGSGKSDMSQLVNEGVMDSCQEQELKLPRDLSAVKSPKGSTTCQDEFVIGSGIDRAGVSNIAIDPPGTAKQGDKLSPSESDLLRNRENTPDCIIDAPELSSDRLFSMDSSARAVPSASGRLRAAGLAVGYSDNKLGMEQVQQDDLQVLEGTLENTAQGSATLESNQQCRLSEEAEPQSVKKICSSSVEQSQFILQSLIPQDDVHEQDGTQEKAAPGSVTPDCKQKCGLPNEAEQLSMNNERCSTSVERLQLLFLQKRIEEPTENVALAVHAKNEVDESKDIHVGYRVEKTPVPESVSDHDSTVDNSAVSKSEDCVYRCDLGLTKSCHEQEQMACQLDLFQAANNMKDFTNPDEVSYDENKKPVHSTDIGSSYEKIDENGHVKHASGLGDGLLSSLLIASTDDTDVHPISNPYLFESTVFLDESKGYSSTEALQQGLKEQCEAPKENQVTYPACPSDMIEAGTAKDLESEDPPLPAEVTSTMVEYLFLGESSKGSDIHGDIVLPSAENEDDSNTCHVELQVENMVPSEPDSSKESDIHGDLVLTSAENEDDSITCHVELQVEKMVSSEPDSHQGSREDLAIVEGFSRSVSSQLEHEKEQLIAPLLAAETSAFLNEQANPELEAAESKNCNFSSEDTSGKIGAIYVKKNLFQLHEGSRMDPIQGKELPNDLPAPKSPEQSTAGQDAQASALSDEQPSPELKGGELKERNLSSEDTSGNLFQLQQGSHMDPTQGKELPDDLPAPKSPEQSTAGQDAEPSALLEEQVHSELEAGESEKCNVSSEDTSGDLFQHQDSHIQGKELPTDLPAPKSPEQSTAGQEAQTSALADEQPSPELKAGELKEHNLSSEDTSGNLFQHEDSHMDPTQGKELPDDLSAPKSPEQSTVDQDAEPSASPDEQPYPELDSSEFEERNLSSEDTGGIFGTQYVDTLFQFQGDSHMDPFQAKGLPNDLPAPKSPEQSTIGQDAETSAWSDEQLNPKLEAGEFGERNFSSEDTSTIFCTGYNVDTLFQLHEYSRTDPNQGKVPQNYLPADKSPRQSTICQDENVLVSETSPLPEEKFNLELEGEEFEEHNHSYDKAARWDDKEGYNQHNDDQATAATLIEKSGSGMAVLSAAGTPALTDEQLNSKLEGNEEHNLCFDGDISYISGTGLMDNNNSSSLPKDFCMDTDEVPVGTPAAKSSGESLVFQDNSVPGSVGTGQTSGRRRIEQRSTKLLSFKISSTVKGSYIAMDSAKTKQGDNPRPISLLRDVENVPAANPDHPAELNMDWLDVKDSSRQGTSDEL